MDMTARIGHEAPQSALFRYQALPEPTRDELVPIRLIRFVDPQCWQDANVPELRLLSATLRRSESELTSNPVYNCLSYVWGPPTPSRTIVLNDLHFTVYDNLYQFLIATGKKLLANTWSLETSLWIDQICINQDDDNEKSAQVKAMGYIYSRASQVYVWLGTGPEKSERLLASIHDAWPTSIYGRIDEVYGVSLELSLRLRFIRLLQAMKSYQTGQPYVRPQQQNTTLPRLNALRVILDGFSSADLCLLLSLYCLYLLPVWRSIHRALRHIYAMSYWTRVWVRPEFLLAQEQIMCIGAAECPYFAFREFIHQLPGRVLPAHGKSGRYVDFLRAMKILQNSIDDTSDSGAFECLRLIDVIRGSLMRGVSSLLIHDRMYAFMSLVQTDSQIAIDYTLDIRQLYWRILDRVADHEIHSFRLLKRLRWYHTNYLVEDYRPLEDDFLALAIELATQLELLDFAPMRSASGRSTLAGLFLNLQQRYGGEILAGPTHDEFVMRGVANHNVLIGAKVRLSARLFAAVRLFGREPLFWAAKHLFK